MIGNIRAEIEYIKSTGEISTIKIPTRKNEISGTSSDLFIPTPGQKLFQLSKDSSTSNRSYSLSERIPWRKRNVKYDGFVSFSKSNSNRVFETASDVTITLTGTNIDTFSIYFDNVAQQWATKLTINGVPYVNNAPIFTWSGESGNSFNIVLNEWNRANVSARITSILVGLTITYDESSILELTRGLQLIPDNTTLSWGVLGQYGSLKLIDIDGVIKNLATAGIIKSGAKIPVRMTLDGKVIGSYISSTWDYKAVGNVVNIDLVSPIERLSKIIYNGYAPQPNKTNLDIFYELRNITVANGFEVIPITQELINHFSNGLQAWLTMEQSTLLEAWQKFTIATSTQFIFNEQNKLELSLYR